MKKKDRLDIIYEDKNYIVVNKPAHLLTIANNNEVIKTLYHQVYEFEKKKNKNNKIFIVHRLDKDTSGVVLFAKNAKLKEMLQKSWNTLAKTREYYAIVEGRVTEKQGTIKQYLKETTTLKTYVSHNKEGQEAITKYEVLQATKNFSILKINILTGRKNQIRVAMESIGHPIIGDKKYSSTKNPLRRVCLHATKLEIINPLDNKLMTFEAKIPEQFAIFK